MVEMVGENTGDVKNTRKCQGAVSCHAGPGRKEWAAREGKCCPPPCRVPPSTVRRSLHCIKPGSRLQAYFRTVRRGDAPGGQRGPGGCRQPCSTKQGPPPHSAILFRANSVPSFPNRILASNHEIRHRPVAVAVAAVTVAAWHLARRSIAPPMNSSIEPLPERLVVVMRSTRSAMDGSEVGCFEHTHTHTRVVYRCKHHPPIVHGHRASGIGRSTGPRRGERGGGEGETRLRACPSGGSSRAPAPATAPAPDHGTSSSALWTERPSTYPRDLVSSASPRLASPLAVAGVLPAY